MTERLYEMKLTKEDIKWLINKDELKLRIHNREKIYNRLVETLANQVVEYKGEIHSLTGGKANNNDALIKEIESYIAEETDVFDDSNAFKAVLRILQA